RVVCDYRSGAEQVMNYLLSLGHRRIGFIHAAQEIRTSRDVMEVYRAKLQSAGVTPRAEWTADGEFTEEGGARAARAISDGDAGVTAFFAGNERRVSSGSVAVSAMFFSFEKTWARRPCYAWFQ